MTYYFNDATGQLATVLGVDDRTNLATVVIDGDRYQMDWGDFLQVFNTLSDTSKPSRINQHRPDGVFGAINEKPC